MIDSGPIDLCHARVDRTRTRVADGEEDVVVTSESRVQGLAIRSNRRVTASRPRNGPELDASPSGASTRRRGRSSSRQASNVPRVPQPTEAGCDDLHVLLRHRLLGQAYGFEGLGFVVVRSHPHGDLPCAHGLHSYRLASTSMHSTDGSLRAHGDAETMYVDVRSVVLAHLDAIGSAKTSQLVRSSSRTPTGSDTTVMASSRLVRAIASQLGTNAPRTSAEVVAQPWPRDRPRTASTFSCDIAAQYAAGSGVGVSVLLRQPDGFEGRLRAEVVPHLDDLPFTHRYDLGKGLLARDTAALRVLADDEDDDQPFAQVTDFEDFGAEVGVEVVQLIPPPANALVASGRERPLPRWPA